MGCIQSKHIIEEPNLDRCRLCNCPVEEMPMAFYTDKAVYCNIICWHVKYNLEQQELYK